MKRFHVHLHVADLDKSVAFYSKLFAAEPARLESDYAKWMLDDPAVNFAISTRGEAGHIDHLGVQTDDPAELAAMKARAEAADMALLDEGATTCCYARSEKHWITDPQGIAWEHFHTLGSIPVFREGEAADASETCCTPGQGSAAEAVPAAAAAQAAACCSPVTEAASTAPAESSACCVPAPAAAEPQAAACCTPRGKPVGIAVKSAGSCC